MLLTTTLVGQTFDTSVVPVELETETISFSWQDGYNHFGGSLVLTPDDGVTLYTPYDEVEEIAIKKAKNLITNAVTELPMPEPDNETEE